MVSMSGTFLRAVGLVLKHEGGYVNDARDPGGETRYGISKRAYPNEDIANLTRERAIELYYKDYWLPIKGDSMSPSVATVLFDMAVNMGVDRAIKLLQRTIKVKEDGVLGPVTLNEVARSVGVLAKLTTERVLAYTAIKNFDVYGRGWVNRSIITALEASV
jgi:lysozyme family protein